MKAVYGQAKPATNPGVNEYKKTRTLPPLGVSDPAYWKVYHRAQHRDLSVYLRGALHLRLLIEAFLELGCDEQVLDEVSPRIQCKACIAAHRAATDVRVEKSV